jgi:branched-chain amino acid transport system ATP-binding protein
MHQIVEKGVSRTFQNIRLFDEMTVIENLVVGMHSQLDSNFIQSLFHTKKEKKKNKQLTRELSLY